MHEHASVAEPTGGRLPGLPPDMQMHEPKLPKAALGSSPDGYKVCRAEARRLRSAGAKRIVAPSAALATGQLRLMVGVGYYDLVTPLGAAEYMLTHSDIPAAATQMHLYPSGHTPYLGDDSRLSLAHDLRAFLSPDRL